jgi:hypothetical protein
MKSSNSAMIDSFELSAAQRALCRAIPFTVRSSRLLKLQAGVRSPELVQLLKTHHSLTAAVVTASNPLGRKMSAAQNKARHTALAAAIKKLKLASLPAERKDQDDADIAEAAYFVLNISGAQAEALLTEFDQHMLLWCNQSGPPELMLHPLARKRCAAVFRY